MKKLLLGVLAMAFGLMAILVIIYGFRLYMNATAPITLHDVEPGVRCAISSGGEAIDCWKVNQGE